MEEINYLVPSKSNSIASFNSNDSNNNSAGSDYNSSSSSLNISNPNLYFNPEYLLQPRSLYNNNSRTKSHSRSQSNSQSYKNPNPNSPVHSHNHSNSQYHLNNNSHKHISSFSNRNRNYTYENKNEKKHFYNNLYNNKNEYNFEDDLPLENDINNGNSIQNYSILESAIKNNMIGSIDDNIGIYSESNGEINNDMANKINENIMEDIVLTKQNDIYNKENKKHINVEIIPKDDSNENFEYSDEFNDYNKGESDDQEGDDEHEEDENEEEKRGRKQIRNKKIKRREQEREITNRSRRNSNESNKGIISNSYMNRNNSKSVSIGSVNTKRSNDHDSSNNHYSYHRHHHHTHHSYRDNSKNNINNGINYSIEEGVVADIPQKKNIQRRSSTDSPNSRNFHSQRRRSSGDHHTHNSHYSSRRSRSKSLNENSYSNNHQLISHHSKQRRNSDDRYEIHSHQSLAMSNNRYKNNISSKNSITSEESDRYKSDNMSDDDFYCNNSINNTKHKQYSRNDREDHHHYHHYKYQNSDSLSESHSNSNSRNSINNYYNHSNKNSHSQLHHHNHYLKHYSQSSSRASISPKEHYNYNNNNNSNYNISNQNYHYHHHRHQNYNNNNDIDRNRHHHHHHHNPNDNSNNNSNKVLNSNYNSTSNNIINNTNNESFSNIENNKELLIENNNIKLSSDEPSNMNNKINDINNYNNYDKGNNGKKTVDFKKSIIINALNSIVSDSINFKFDKTNEVDTDSRCNINIIDDENKFTGEYIKTAVGNIIVEICDSNDEDRNDEFIRIEEINDDEALKIMEQNKNLNSTNKPKNIENLIACSIEKNNESPLLMAVNDEDNLEVLENGKSKLNLIKTIKNKDINNEDSYHNNNYKNDNINDDDDIDKIIRKSKSAPIKINLAMKNEIENILLYSPFYPNENINKKIINEIKNSSRSSDSDSNKNIFESGTFFNNFNIKKLNTKDINILDSKIKSFIPVSELKKRKNISCITMKGGFDNIPNNENNSLIPFIKRSSNMEIKSKKLDELIKYPEHSYDSILNMKMFIFNELNDREKREMKANNFFIFDSENEKDILTEDFDNNAPLITSDKTNKDEMVSTRSEKSPIQINDKGKHYSNSYTRGVDEVSSIHKKPLHKSKKSSCSLNNSRTSSLCSSCKNYRNRSCQSSEISEHNNDRRSKHNIRNNYKKKHHRNKLHSSTESNYNINNNNNNISRANIYPNNNKNINNRYLSSISGLTSRPTLSRLLYGGDSEIGQSGGVYRHHRRHHHHHRHHNHKSQHKKNDASNSSSNISAISNNKKRENVESTSDMDTSSSSDTTSSSSIYTPSNYNRNNIDYQNQYASMNSTNQYWSRSNNVSKKELHSSSHLFSEFVPIENTSLSRLSYNSSSNTNTNTNTNNDSTNFSNSNITTTNSKIFSGSILFNLERGPSYFNSNMNSIPEVEVVRASVTSRVNISEIPELDEHDEVMDEENIDNIFESRDFNEIYNPIINPTKVKAKSDIHLLNRYNSTQKFKGSLNSTSQFLHLPKNLKNRVVSSPSKFETNYYTISYRKAIPRSEWKPDNSTDHCKICGKKFSFFVRRHHCRLCGYIFCGSCCQRKIPLIIDDNDASTENFKKHLYNMFNSNSNYNTSQSSDKFRNSSRSASECLSSILEIYQSKNNFLVCPIQCKVCEMCFTKYYIN